jgi:tetratricopeptide (TPR) repeat protein
LFEPAKRDGQPVLAVITFGFTFELDGGSDAPETKKWFADIKQKAEAGDPAAQYVQAMILSGDPQFNEPWGNVLPWIEKSAQAGFAPAQYQLGESLLTGRGCEADSSKAMEWLRLAAQQDQPDAQETLARLLLKPGSSFDAQKALFWLGRASEHGSARANKYLGALLACSADETIRNPTRALELVDEVERGDAQEPATIEIRAAAYANLGNYKAAIKSQTLAIKRASGLHWDVSEMNSRLDAYSKSEPWYGELIPF